MVTGRVEGGADCGGVESVSTVGASNCKPIPSSTGWGRLPTAVGRETSEVLTSVSNESIEVENKVPPPRLGTLVPGFVYSSRGRRMTDRLGGVWSKPLSKE